MAASLVERIALRMGRENRRKMHVRIRESRCVRRDTMAPYCANAVGWSCGALHESSPTRFSHRRKRVKGGKKDFIDKCFRWGKETAEVGDLQHLAPRRSKTCTATATFFSAHNSPTFLQIVDAPAGVGCSVQLFVALRGRSEQENINKKEQQQQQQEQ